MPIQQLAPDVAAKIAAGEVVERPASVVKELVENALDAGAASVRVELLGGGLDLIRVVDDGRGIPAAELPLAFARHATSKIAALDDLARLATLGFRGEALASIAAVAEVTLLSRPAGAARGARLTVAEGVPGALMPAGAPTGTSVTVRGLFAAMPARLKFLKAHATEAAHCLHLVEQYALAYPAVRFSALSEQRQVFAAPGDGRLASALAAVYGVALAAQMVPLPGSDDGPDALPALPPAADDPPRLAGYVSRPSCYKATRQALSFFVNRRWVQSRTLAYAVEEAYHSLLLAGRHPIAAIQITLDPSQVDVNVHPAKAEIRFLRERQVYAAVQRAVRAAVLATAEAPELSGRAFGVPAWGATAGGGDGASAAGVAPLAAAWAAGGTAAEPAPRGAAGGFALPAAAPEAAGAPVGGQRLPAMRVLGQVSQSYIITEGPTGMYLVDQHAAHERVLLERMIADVRDRAVASQLLLDAQLLDGLMPAEREAIEQQLAALAGIGFAIEPFGETALLVRAVPAALAPHAAAQPLRELLLGLAGAGAEAASHGETWEEHALANVACKAAIKAGQPLAPEEQRALIRQLEQTAGRQSCCHGRPTMVHLSLSALEREFDRR